MNNFKTGLNVLFVYGAAMAFAFTLAMGYYLLSLFPVEWLGNAGYAIIIQNFSTLMVMIAGFTGMKKHLEERLGLAK